LVASCKIRRSSETQELTIKIQANIVRYFCKFNPISVIRRVVALRRRRKEFFLRTIFVLSNSRAAVGKSHDQRRGGEAVLSWVVCSDVLQTRVERYRVFLLQRFLSSDLVPLRDV
jgi:hypothetical protein